MRGTFLLNDQTGFFSQNSTIETTTADLFKNANTKQIIKFISRIASVSFP